MSDGREAVCTWLRLGAFEGRQSLVLDHVCSFKCDCYLAETAIEIDRRLNREM